MKNTSNNSVPRGVKKNYRSFILLRTPQGRRYRFVMVVREG